MQPILAEPVSHRGRAVALAVVLTLVTSIAALAATSRHPRGHRHHTQLHWSQCRHGYVYVSR